MASGYIETMLDNVDAAVDSYVLNVYAGIASEMSTTLRILFILFIIIYGFSSMQGWIQTSLQDMVKNYIRLVFIFVFALNWTIFNDFVYTLFTDSPNYLGGVMLSAVPGAFTNTSSVNGALGDIYDKVIYSASIMMFNSDITDIVTSILGLVLGAIAFLMVIYATFLIAMAKIAVAILLGLAPVFLALMTFQVTRGLFEGWLRQLLNFAFIPVITYGILIFVISLNNPVVAALEAATGSGSPGTSYVFPVLLSTGVSVVLLMQVMGIAAGIAGGMQLSTLGTIGSAVGSAFRRTRTGRLGIYNSPSTPKLSTNSISNK